MNGYRGKLDWNDAWLSVKVGSRWGRWCKKRDGYRELSPARNSFEASSAGASLRAGLRYLLKKDCDGFHAF